MKERPILFSAPMVRAILEGRKTQTRRVMNPQPNDQTTSFGCLNGVAWMALGGDPKDCDTWTTEGDWLQSPYGLFGDRLWVRETWFPAVDGDSIGEKPGWYEWTPDPDRPVPDDGYNEPDCIMYRATDDFHPERWRSAIFMPRWASRITLEISEVRVERVQEISEEDAIAEGVSDTTLSASYTGIAHKARGRCKLEYASLWNAINGKRGFGWDKNPWVWVLEFKRV